MTVNKSFEAYKIKREILRSGIEVTFYRWALNDFGEPDKSKEPEMIGKAKGLYHEQNSYIEVIHGEETRYRAKKIPMFLTLYEYIDDLNLKADDIVFINNSRFSVNKLSNIQEWGIAVDISLEVLDDGHKNQ